ncbi:MAG TPA: isochorismatase family cysteine hydrolase [Acetobacteraceae bacterium]|jgi:biuret amidohydrolase|nr:isochorismatase family cysteine hydrolase [Acetobacteraceae bacterium]
MQSIAAEPHDFASGAATTALVIIDRQRDFLEPGGFGAALSNDVGVLRACRSAGMLLVHTRERHRPDLSDLAPAERVRGPFPTGIGDAGPMGRILVRGEPGHEIVPELAPEPGEPVVDKPGKGAFYATDLEAILRSRGMARTDRRQR